MSIDRRISAPARLRPSSSLSRPADKPGTLSRRTISALTTRIFSNSFQTRRESLVAVESRGARTSNDARCYLLARATSLFPPIIDERVVLARSRGIGNRDFSAILEKGESSVWCRAVRGIQQCGGWSSVRWRGWIFRRPKAVRAAAISFNYAHRVQRVFDLVKIAICENALVGMKLREGARRGERKGEGERREELRR